MGRRNAFHIVVITLRVMHPHAEREGYDGVRATMA